MLILVILVFNMGSKW